MRKEREGEDVDGVGGGHKVNIIRRLHEVGWEGKDGVNETKEGGAEGAEGAEGGKGRGSGKMRKGLKDINDKRHKYDKKEKSKTLYTPYKRKLNKRKNMSQTYIIRRRKGSHNTYSPRCRQRARL